MKPVIITAAITGGHPPGTRGDAHPVTPFALLRDSLACWRAGAAIIHFHARRDDGHTTMDAGAYSHLAAAIRAAGCDAVIDFSAGDDGGRATHGERLAVPTAGAEIVTYSGGSFNLGSRLYDNRMLRADPALIALLVGYLPQGSEWSVSGQTGSDYIAHDRLLQFALSNAGHVRTGFEDTMLLSNGMPASNNAELVLQWVHAANSLGRPVATPTEARTILRLAM